MSVGLEELITQQQMTNRLLALLIRRMFPESLPQHEVIAALKETDATDEEIAQVLGTTPATVSTTLHRKRRGGAGGARQRGAEDGPPGDQGDPAPQAEGGEG